MANSASLSRHVVQVVAAASRDVCKDGFSVIETDHLTWQPDLKALRDGIVTLMQHGWHPSFILMYDEAWLLLHNLRRLMRDGVCQ